MRLETVAISKSGTFCLRGMTCSMDDITENATSWKDLTKYRMHHIFCIVAAMNGIKYNTLIIWNELNVMLQCIFFNQFTMRNIQKIMTFLVLEVKILHLPHWYIIYISVREQLCTFLLALYMILYNDSTEAWGLTIFNNLRPHNIHKLTLIKLNVSCWEIHLKACISPVIIDHTYYD